MPIRILRIHMEDDAAKMVHVGGAEGRITAAAESLVDYNRCGTPADRARHRAPTCARPRRLACLWKSSVASL